MQDSWRDALLDCNMSKYVWALETKDLVDFLCENQHFWRLVDGWQH